MRAHRRFALPLALAVGLFGAGTAGAQATGSIRGEVLNEYRRPMPDVEVVLGGGIRIARTNARGLFRIDSLAPGRYPITVRYPGYAPQRAAFVLDRGEVVEVDVVLVPLPQVLDSVIVVADRQGLHGVVGDSGGRPLAGARVRVYGGGDSEPTDSAGRFAFPEMKPGAYLVEATFPGLVGRPLHVTVPSQGSREVVLFLVPPGQGPSSLPGMQWVYHDLGLRLSFQPSSTRMTREELARHEGRQLCDIARLRSVLVDDTPTVIVDGITRLEDWPLCSWTADELALVEWGACVVGGQETTPLSMRTTRVPTSIRGGTRGGKRSCIMVWLR